MLAEQTTQPVNNQAQFQNIPQNAPQAFNGYSTNPYYQVPQPQGFISTLAGTTPQSGLVRGVLIGAALTYVLTRPKVKKAILDTIGVSSCTNIQEDEIVD